MLKIDIEKFRMVCENAHSMQHASALLNMHFNTFKKYAIQLNCYKPNQAGKLVQKNKPNLILLTDILNGKHPSYQTNKLKKRLISEQILPNICSSCDTGNVWQNRPLVLELDHIDGNNRNHSLNNLRLLCPNCHSQTPTFRGKNTKKLTNL